jgi:hypothetical protein
MNLGVKAQFEKVTDRAEYPKCGLTHTLDLVINSKLVCGGRISTEPEVMTWVAS